MKRILLVFAALSLMVASCGKDGKDTDNNADEPKLPGVDVGMTGIKDGKKYVLLWRDRNIGAVKVGDPGNFYNWNEAMALSAESEDAEVATLFRDGWHLPMKSDTDALIYQMNYKGLKSTWEDAADDALAGYELCFEATGGRLFLPATGFINSFNGYQLNQENIYGGFWTSTSVGDFTQAALFSYTKSNGIKGDGSAAKDRDKYPVRLIKEYFIE